MKARCYGLIHCYVQRNHLTFAATGARVTTVDLARRRLRVIFIRFTPAAILFLAAVRERRNQLGSTPSCARMASVRVLLHLRPAKADMTLAQALESERAKIELEFGCLKYRSAAKQPRRVHSYKRTRRSLQGCAVLSFSLLNPFRTQATP